jgi:solute carrier family 25 protein 44
MITTISGFLSGATASCSAAVMGVPADIISQRQMIKTDKSQMHGNQFRDTIALIKEINSENGLRGFYRGYFATIITYAPSSAIWWASYSAARRALAPWASDSRWKQVLLPSICGVSAAFASATITNPLDVAKTRIQISRVRLPYPTQSDVPISKPAALTIPGVLKEIYRQEGLVRMWTKGLSARIANMSLFATLMSSAYEGVKYLSRK